MSSSTEGTKEHRVLYAMEEEEVEVDEEYRGKTIKVHFFSF